MTERLIAKIEKNSRETLRITLDEFKGHRLINFRIWFRAEDGTMRPGREGVALKVDKLDEILSALHRARGVAGDLGWSEPAICEAARGRVQW